MTARAIAQAKRVFIAAFLMALLSITRRGPYVAAMLRAKTRRNNTLEEQPLFQLDFAPSIANLPRQVNGVSSQAVWTSDGAGSYTAEVGEALSSIGSGDAPIDGGDYHPLSGSSDHSTSHRAGTSFETQTVGHLNIGTGHAVYSALIYVREDAVTEYFYEKYASSVGVLLGILNTHRLYAVVGGGSAGPDSIQSGTLAPGAWYFVEFYLTATTGNWFVNGAASGGTLDVTGYGDKDAATVANIGSNAGSSVWSGAMSSLFVTHGAALLDGVTIADLHKENFARLTGTYATKAKGSALPTTMTRASAKHIWKDDASGNRIGVQVGAGWPDVCRVWDGTQLLTGYRGENAVTNLVPYSDDISHADWVKSAVAAAADGTSRLGRTRYRLTGDGSTASHSIADDVSLTDGVTYCFSAFFEAGTDGYGWIEIESPGIVGAIINLATGAVHAEIGAPDNSFVIDEGGGVYRLCVVATNTTTADRSAEVGVSNDGNVVCDSSGYIYCHGGIQVEAGAYPTSPIYTSGGTASRVVDVEYGKGDDGNVSATGIDVRFDTVFMSTTAPAGTLVEFNDGGAGVERVVIATDSNGYVTLATTDASSAQSSITGTTDIRDGAAHSVRAVIRQDSVTLYVDGVVEGTPDTSADMPSNLDRIYLGDDYDGGDAQDHAIVSSFKVYA